MRVAAVICFLLVCCLVGADPVDRDTRSNESNEDATPRPLPKPVIMFLRVNSDIRFRYARTVVSTRISNPALASQEVTFSAVLPESAFISGFQLVTEDAVYNGYVREKEEATEEYSRAVREGRTAAHVALSARDAKRFTVAVNVEPNKKVTFKLTYEELLVRERGVYRHVVSLDPGQVVRELSVVTRIHEASDISALAVPALRHSNEVLQTESNNSLATIERPNVQSAVVRFAPTREQQSELSSEGIQGQLVVEYDVDRSARPGEILVNDGYFIHFFVPEDLSPLNKHVVFVLDVSGSMRGRKIEQLKEAMNLIITDLHDGDYFSIVPFSTTVQVWDYNATDEELRSRRQRLGETRWGDYGEEEETATSLTPGVIAANTVTNRDKAKNFIDELPATGATNINDALMKALQISNLGRTLGRPEAMIVFLTDGKANVGTSEPRTMLTTVRRQNAHKTSVFSLALGSEADFSFLKKLSLRNSGFARKIYEAADTALQLRDFYRQVASPLLTNVTFKYESQQVRKSSLTRRNFRRVFSGSELVVAGRLQSDNVTVTAQVNGRSSIGNATYPFTPTAGQTNNSTLETITPMERMWAYITIQQLLNKKEADISLIDNSSLYSEEYFVDLDEDEDDVTPTVLQLALRYSFVTPLTSLVVVKPNGSNAVDTEDASGQVSQTRSGTTRTAGSRPALSNPQYRITETSIQLALANLSDVTWLPAVTGNSAVSLPTGLNGTTEELRMASVNETNVPYAACITPRNEDGHCRLFRYCVLNVFVNDHTQFIPYFCRIGSYIGVCCPDSLQAANN